MGNENGEVYYTFGMIKPDGMKYKEEIIRMILRANLKIDYFKCDMLTDELIDENYSHVKEKHPEDFKLLKESLKSGPVLMMLIYDLDGDAVGKYRRILGCTESWQADPNTIRGRFGDKHKVYKNAAHGSGNKKEAKDEIIRFFKNEIDSLLRNIRSMGKQDEMLTEINRNRVVSSNMISYSDEIDIRVDEINKFCAQYIKKIGK